MKTTQNYIQQNCKMEYEYCTYQSKHKFDEFIINKLIEQGWEIYVKNVKYGRTYYCKGWKLKNLFG